MLHVAKHGAEQHGDALRPHRLLDPAAERNLVVVDDRGERPVPVVERLVLPAEIAQNVVGNAAGELVAMRAVGEQAAECADDGVYRLAAEHRQAVDDEHLAAETRRLDRGRNAGDAGADDADVSADALCALLAVAPDDARAGRDFRLSHAAPPVDQDQQSRSSRLGVGALFGLSSDF